MRGFVSARSLSALLLAVAWGAGTAAARADELPCAPAPAPASDVLIGIPAWECVADRWERQRAEYPISFEVGATFWWHIDRETGDVTYGYPGAEGAYSWYVKGRVAVPPGEDARFGLHVDVRWRERTRFAPYYEGRLWLQEGYLFGQVAGGELQVGKVLKHFGLESDGTWWCALPYYDGFASDPDWGVSWQRTFAARGCFSVDGTAQVFFAEDHVAGSNVGADAESDPERDEGLSTVVRVAPTWTWSDERSLAIGLSGTLGQIRGNGVPDDTFSGFAVDATLTLGPWKAIAAGYLVSGVRNGENYVTAGPSDRLEDVVLSLERSIGPVTLRACWSGGWLHAPDGDQSMWIACAQIALIRNVDLYLEYVRWTAQAEGADEVTLEDGFQVIVVWKL